MAAIYIRSDGVKENGFSQESFAYAVGLDRTYMGSVERGERNIAALNFIKIAKTLRVKVGVLFSPAESLTVIVFLCSTCRYVCTSWGFTDNQKGRNICA